MIVHDAFGRGARPEDTAGKQASLTPAYEWTAPTPIRILDAMTRYGIDVGVAIQVIRESIEIPEAHSLVGPNVLRSQALSTVYQAHRRNEVTRDEAMAMLEGITTMRIRLLGDRVSRAVAWQVAEQLGWQDIGAAEYVAVAKLQADAFVTLDASLARQLDGIVATAPFNALTAT